MSWHAVDAIDRAVDATRRFLFPFEAVRWAKLAFLALVMAGGGAGASHGGASNVGVSAAGIGVWSETDRARGPDGAVGVGEFGVGEFGVGEFSVGPIGDESALTEIGSVSRAVERLVDLDDAVLVAVAAGALLVAVVVVACSIAFRLAFYDALATTEVALWRPLRDRFRQALGLLAFVTALAAAAMIPAIAFVVAVDPTALRAVGVSLGGFSGVSTVAAAALGALSVGTALVGIVGSRLTFEFVAPAMVARDVGVIAGWRTIWASFRGSWAEVVVYIAIHAVLAAGAGIVQAVAVAFAAGIVAVIVLVALVLSAVPLGGVGALIGTTAGVAVLVALLICGVVAVVILTLPVRLVARTYLIAYEVSTLVGVDPALAPLASTLGASGNSHVGDESKSTGE